MIGLESIISTLILFYICFSFGQVLLISVCGGKKALELVYFSPAVGLAFWVVLSSYIVKYTGLLFPGFVAVFYLLFILTLIFNYRYSAITRSYWVTLTMFCCVAALPALMQLLRFGIFSPFGGDPIFYINVAERMNHALFYHPIVFSSGTELYFPSLGFAQNWQTQDAKLGSMFLLAVFQKALHLKWAYQAYPMLVALSMVIAGTTVIAAIQLIMKKSPFWIALMFGLALVVTPNGYNWAALVGFYPQAIMTPILMTLFSLLWYFSMDSRFERIVKTVDLKEIGLCALLFAALLFSYPDIVLPFFGTMGLFSLYYLFRSPMDALKVESIKILKIFTLFLLGATILAFHECVTFFASNNFIMGLFAHGIASKPPQVGSPNNWHVTEYISLAFGLRPWDEQGLQRAYGMCFQGMRDLRHYIHGLTIVFIALIAYAMAYRPYRRYALSLPFIFVMLILGCLLIWFRYFTPSPWPAGVSIGHSFLQLRTATWSAMGCFILLGSAIVLLAPHHRWLKMIVVILLPLWIAVGYIHTYRLAETAVKDLQQETDGQGFAGFEQIRKALDPIPHHEPVFIDLPYNSNIEVWLRYVFWDRMIVGRWIDKSDKAYYCSVKWRLYRTKRPPESAILVFGSIVLSRVPPRHCER